MDCFECFAYCYNKMHLTVTICKYVTVSVFHVNFNGIFHDAPEYLVGLLSKNVWG